MREGYDSIEELIAAVFSDSVSPAICVNEGCDFTCEMEPDQDAGYCEECHTNTMVAAHAHDLKDIVHDSVGDDMSYGWNQPNGRALGREIIVVEFHNDQL
jgi:hypothetical protein